MTSDFGTEGLLKWCCYTLTCEGGKDKDTNNTHAETLFKLSRERITIQAIEPPRKFKESKKTVVRHGESEMVGGRERVNNPLPKGKREEKPEKRQWKIY